MSQRIADAFLSENGPQDRPAPYHEEYDLALIQRYLAVLEDNKKASRSAISDAGMAMDMAGFVRQQLQNTASRPRLSPALMALALVQREADGPQQ
ncbi:MAG: hypothetical protein PHI96_05195 [Desulfovibrio sp.]|nr:hypothetical protein [Desulfovibrio sp.]